MADQHTDALPALLPCPFCGSDKVGWAAEYDGDGFGVYHSIKCQGCMGQGAQHYVSNGNDCPQHRQEVRDSWNRRAALASRAEGVEPVAWRDHVEHRLKTWQHRTMNESGDRVTLSDFMDQGSIDDLIDFVCDEYADPAPSHPAAGVEPIRTSSCLEGKYGNVLAPFVALMEAELHANSRKGDRPGWLSMTPEVALLEIYWHTAKLSAAVKNKDAGLVREHSADVANMAMMLLDVCGGLDVAPEQAPSHPAAQGAGEREAFEAECDAADELMRLLGLDPDRCRTEGGAVNLARVRTLLDEARASAPSQADGWQPIETEPKDMAARLYLCGDTIVEGFIDATGNRCVRQEGGGGWRAMWKTPTHWQPLPAAPAAAQSEGA